MYTCMCIGCWLVISGSLCFYWLVMILLCTSIVSHSYQKYDHVPFSLSYLSLSLTVPPPSQLSFVEEMSSNLFFPEFCELPSSVTSLDMKVVGTQRLTVFGCQNGHLQCSLVDITAGSKFTLTMHPQPTWCVSYYSEVLRCWTSDMMDGPITSVNLFTLFSKPDGTSTYNIISLYWNNIHHLSR